MVSGAAATAESRLSPAAEAMASKEDWWRSGGIRLQGEVVVCGGDPNLGQEGEKQEEHICRVSHMSKEQAGCGKERNTLLHPNHPKTLVDLKLLSFIPWGPLDPFHLLTLPEFPLTFHSSPSLTLYMPLPPLNWIYCSKYGNTRKSLILETGNFA